MDDKKIKLIKPTSYEQNRFALKRILDQRKKIKNLVAIIELENGEQQIITSPITQKDLCELATYLQAFVLDGFHFHEE